MSSSAVVSSIYQLTQYLRNIPPNIKHFSLQEASIIDDSFISRLMQAYEGVQLCHKNLVNDCQKEPYGHAYEAYPQEGKELQTVLEYAERLFTDDDKAHNAKSTNGNIQLDDDMTDLHLAVLNNEDQIKIQDLILAAKNPMQYILTKDRDGKIPAHYLYLFKGSAFSTLLVFLIEIKRNNKKAEVQKNIQKFLKTQDNEGRDLLHLASMNADVQTIKTILDQFNDLDEMIAYMKTVDKYGKTFIHYLADLSYDTIYLLDKEKPEFILTTLSDKVDRDTLVKIFNIKDNNNKTALYYAFFNKNCTLLGLYILKMFNSSQIKALLNVKIENGEDLVYEELGNRRDLLNAEIDERKAFFNEEIDERKAQIKEALEDRKELLDFEIDGKKKLLQEELDRRKEILSEELSHRKDLLTFDIIKGKTLFHHLVMHIDEDLVLQVFYLLDILDLIPLINTFDNEKKSPLHLAAIAKNARVFEEILYLFDNDEDRKRYIKQKDMYGRTPLHYVSKYSELTITPFTVYSEVAKREISFDPYQRFINIVQIIQDSLQDEFSDFVNVKDTDGKTSLLNCIKDMRYLVTILSCIDQDRIATCLDNTQANC